MRITDLFPLSGQISLAVLSCAVALAVQTGAANAQSAFTMAPTPVYGSTESQAGIRYQGPGLPGSEAQQPIASGSRHALFDVAGYDGVIYSPVTPPYNAAATYRTYAGQPGHGADAVAALGVDGAP